MTRNIDLWGTAIVAGAIFSAVSNLGAQNNPGGSAQPQQQSQGGRQQNISADQCQRAKDSVDAKYSDGISHLNAAFAQNRNNPRFSQAKYNEYLSELKRLHDQGMTQAIKNNCTVSSQPPADQFNTQTGGQQAQQNQPQGNPNQGGQTDLGGGGPLGGSPNQPIRGGVQQNVPAPAPPSGPVVADQFNSGGGSQPNSETGVIVSITNLRNGNCDVKIKNPRTGYVHSVTVLCGTVATFKAGDSVIESRNPRGQVALTRPGQSEPADQFSSNSGTASSGGSQPPAEGPGVIVSITPFGNGDWDVKIKNPRTGYIHSVTCHGTPKFRVGYSITGNQLPGCGGQAPTDQFASTGTQQPQATSPPAQTAPNPSAPDQFNTQTGPAPGLPNRPSPIPGGPQPPLPADFVTQSCECEGEACLRPSRYDGGNPDQARAFRLNLNVTNAPRVIRIVDVNYFYPVKDGALFSAAAFYNDPNAFTVAGHIGQYTGKEAIAGLVLGEWYIYDAYQAQPGLPHGGSQAYIPPGAIAGRIRSDPKWRGRPIVFFACNAGAFAQRVANELGVTVFGPSGKLHAQGATFTIKNADGTIGRFIPHNPQRVIKK